MLSYDLDMCNWVSIVRDTQCNIKYEKNPVKLCKLEQTIRVWVLVSSKT